MTAVTNGLHCAILASLGEAVRWNSLPSRKPLCVDLAPPNPPRIRIYAYSLVGGVGTVRPNEYKAVLRVPGQKVGEYGSFDHSDERFVLVIGYREELDVFVLWDAILHSQFKNGTNIQVRDTVVHLAAAVGGAEQLRLLPSGTTEVVIACQSWNLLDAINARLISTGGVTPDEQRSDK